MRNRWLPPALAVAAFIALPATKAFAQGRELDTLVRSNMVVDEIIDKNKKGLPPQLLRHAYAIAVFPNIVKGGFVVGGRFGHGLVLVRQGDQWSYPIFASLGGGSFGFQAGLQSTDLVLVFKSRGSLDSFFSGKDKVTIGGDGSLALGGMGRHAEAGTGIGLKSQYVAYSRNRGLFAGASLAGTALAIDWRSNSLFYGRSVSPADIMAKSQVSIPKDALPSVLALQSTMARKMRMGMEMEVIEFPKDPSEVEIIQDGPATTARPARRAPRVNSDDAPSTDGPDLLPIPPDSGSAVTPRAGTTTRSSTTTKSSPAPKAKAARSRDPLDDLDLDVDPGQSSPEPPSTKRATPKRVKSPDLDKPAA